jgi:hypothetical protein
MPRGAAGAPPGASGSGCASQCDLDAYRCNLACDAANPLRVANVAASTAFFACTTTCETSAMQCRCACSAALCGQ